MGLKQFMPAAVMDGAVPPTVPGTPSCSLRGESRNWKAGHVEQRRVAVWAQAVSISGTAESGTPNGQCSERRGVVCAPPG